MSKRGADTGTSAAAMLVGRLVVAAFSWVGTALIARDLDQEAFGQFILVFSLLGMMSIVTDLGLGRIAVIILSPLEGAERARMAGTYVMLRLGLGLVGYALALGVVVVAGYPSPVLAATAVAGLVVVAATPSHAYDVAFQLKDRLPSLAAVGVVAQLAQVALTIALVLEGGTVVWFAVPPVLNELIQLLWKIPAANRLITFDYNIDLRAWVAMTRRAGPLTAGAAFVTLYYRVDSIMLASLDTFTSVGLYGVAYKFVDLIHFVPTALTVAALAPLSRAWIHDREDYADQIRTLIGYLAVAAGGVVVSFMLFGPQIATLFYGSDYADSGNAVRVLVSAEVIGYFSAISLTALLAANRYRMYPVFAGIGLMFNIIANFVLIPRYSYMGAAWTTLFTEAIVGVMLWRQLVALGTERLVVRRSAGLLAITMALSATAGSVGLRYLPWVAAAILAGLLYLGLVVRFRLVDLRRASTADSSD